MPPAKRRSNRNTPKTGSLGVDTAASMQTASKNEGESPLSTPSPTPEPSMTIPQTNGNGNGTTNGNLPVVSVDAQIENTKQNGVNGAGMKVEGEGEGETVNGTGVLGGGAARVGGGGGKDEWDEQKCPACTEATERKHSSRKENWIECDNCNTWYHWRCAGNGEDVNAIAKWSVLCSLSTFSTEPTQWMTSPPFFAVLFYFINFFIFPNLV